MRMQYSGLLLVLDMHPVGIARRTVCAVGRKGTTPMYADQMDSVKIAIKYGENPALMKSGRVKAV
jgi:hypothetical protein